MVQEVMVRTGRPPKLPANRRSVVLKVRLTSGEYKNLCDASKKAGMSVSAYARKKLGG